MRWGDMRPSDNVEQGGSGGGGFPLGGGMRLGGGAVILIVIVSLIFGINPLSMLGMMEGGGPVVQSAAVADRTVANERATCGQGSGVRHRAPRRRRHRGRLDRALQADGLALRAADAA